MFTRSRLIKSEFKVSARPAAGRRREDVHLDVHRPLFVKDDHVRDDVERRDEEAEPGEPPVQGRHRGVADLEDCSEAANLPAESKDERQHRERDEACRRGSR
jgi:hypothetical protein